MGGTDESSRHATRHDGWSEDGRRPGPSISEELEETFERTVDEGEFRLSRTWPGLLATGFVGGVDVAFGVIGLLVVIHATGNRLLGSLAFGVGFIALTLARSELFTENFLVPIAAVVAKKAAPVAVVRLWGGTAAMNLLASWVMMGLLWQRCRTSAAPPSKAASTSSISASPGDRSRRRSSGERCSPS